MKTGFIMIFLALISYEGLAQKDFDIVVSLGTSLNKMSETTSNPKINEVDNQVNFDLRSFIDYERTRFGFTFKSQQASNFYKWALVIDHKFTDLPIRNLVVCVGPEIGLIKRTNRESYLSTTHDWVQLGANLEFNYTIPNTNFSLGAVYNAYRAEQDLREMGTLFRHDINFLVSLRLGS